MFNLTNRASDRGLSLFFTSPGERQSMHCVLCGSRCKVKRNVYGPTSFVMAMGKLSKLHDVHECPHRDHPLHRRALEQRSLVNDLPVGSLQTLARSDFSQTLRELQLEIGTPMDNND